MEDTQRGLPAPCAKALSRGGRKLIGYRRGNISILDGDGMPLYVRYRTEQAGARREDVTHETLAPNDHPVARPGGLRRRSTARSEARRFRRRPGGPAAPPPTSVRRPGTAGNPSARP